MQMAVQPPEKNLKIKNNNGLCILGYKPFIRIIKYDDKYYFERNLQKYLYSFCRADGYGKYFDIRLQRLYVHFR